MENYTPFEVYLENLFRKSNPAHSSLVQTPPLNTAATYLTPHSINLSHLLPQSPTILQPTPLLPGAVNRRVSPPATFRSNKRASPQLPTPLRPNPQLYYPLPSPLMTSTPVEVTSQHIPTPPRTPGTTASPPQFFFPPDFNLPSETNQLKMTPPNLPNQKITPPAARQTSSMPLLQKLFPGLPSPPETPAQTFYTFGKTQTDAPARNCSTFGKTPKLKRRRTKFTPSQIDALEREFGDCLYITTERRRVLAAELGVTSENIRVWFQNRRHLMKKILNNQPKMVV